MKKISFLSLLIISISCFAQDQTNEFLWSGLGTKMKFSNKIRLDLEHQVRFNDNFNRYDYTFTELGLNYKPSKKIRINGNYRLMHYERGVRHRYALEGHYTFSLPNSNFYFHIRERLQTFVWNDDNTSSTNIRNLFTLGYKMKKIAKIYTTQEWFYRLDKINEFKTYRGTIGVTWSISEKISLMTYYSLQKAIKTNTKLTSHIVGIRGFYKINFVKKDN
jgi:hypothetical protein